VQSEIAGQLGDHGPLGALPPSDDLDRAEYANLSARRAGGRRRVRRRRRIDDGLFVELFLIIGPRIVVGESVGFGAEGLDHSSDGGGIDLRLTPPPIVFLDERSRGSEYLVLGSAAVRHPYPAKGRRPSSLGDVGTMVNVRLSAFTMRGTLDLDHVNNVVL
jgi:hypothetical protein